MSRIPFLTSRRMVRFPNDNVSDQPAIVSAIAAAEANGSGVVFFPPGEFLVNTDADKNDEGYNEPIYIYSSNIVLRGSGSRKGGTIIRMVNYMSPLPDRPGYVSSMFNFQPVSFSSFYLNAHYRECGARNFLDYSGECFQALSRSVDLGLCEYCGGRSN